MGLSEEQRSIKRDAGQALQCTAGDAGDPPVREYDGAKALVKANGALVPIQHRPLEPTALPCACNSGERGQQGSADSSAAVLGPHEQILEPQRPAAKERRKSMKK